MTSIPSVNLKGRFEFPAKDGKQKYGAKKEAKKLIIFAKQRQRPTKSGQSGSRRWSSGPSCPRQLPRCPSCASCCSPCWCAPPREIPPRSPPLLWRASPWCPPPRQWMTSTASSSTTTSSRARESSALGGTPAGRHPGTTGGRR